MNPTADGAYIQWDNVDGLAGGTRTIRIRYANGGVGSRTASLIINGVAQNIAFPVTGSFEDYSLLSINAPLNSGTTNTIRLETTGQDSGNIDELQVLP